MWFVMFCESPIIGSLSLLRIVVDPEGYSWMIATHKAEPTPKEMMMKKMMEQIPGQPISTPSG
jgi:hypothetical protein